MSQATRAGERTIGLGGATIIGLGAIVGGGILALAGTAFGVTGPSALLAFLLNGVIALLTAVAYAEMSSAFPENGGSYAFTKKVLSVQAAFAVGWILLFASIAAGVLYALGFAAYATEAAAAIWQMTGERPPDWLRGRALMVAAAVAVVGFYTLVLTRRQGGTGKAETIGKLIVFGIIIVIGGWRLILDPGDAIEGKLTPFFSAGPVGLVSAMGYTFIALQGFDIIAAVAGEVRDPKRTLPRAMIGSVGIALVVYLPLLFIIMTVGVPRNETVTELALQRPETMVADAVANFFGPAGFWLVMVAALLSMASALFANLLAASRIALAMASDRTLPRVFAKTNARTGIPVRAVLACALLMTLILFVVPDVGAAGAAAGLIFLISFALTHFTNIMARRRMGAEFKGFTAPWFPVLQTVGAATCCALAVFQSLAIPAAGSVAAVWLLGGFVLYFFRFAERAGVVDARSEALDPDLVRLRGRDPLVLVPLASPARARTMVELAGVLAPPRTGRIVLLSVLNAGADWGTGEPPTTLTASQDVMRTALVEAARRRLHVSSVTTMSDDTWAEIVRVATAYRAETLLLGLSDLSTDAVRLPLEHVIDETEADVVVLGSPPGWTLESAKRILVPVAGAGTHDRLRARLVGGLCRSRSPQMVFMRVVPADTPEKEQRRLERQLRDHADEEAPGHATALIVASDDFLAAVAEQAAESDLVILGTQRGGRRRAIGPVALRVARATSGGVILISHRLAAGAALASRF